MFAIQRSVLEHSEVLLSLPFPSLCRLQYKAEFVHIPVIAGDLWCRLGGGGGGVMREPLRQSVSCENVSSD